MALSRLNIELTQQAGLTDLARTLAQLDGLTRAAIMACVVAARDSEMATGLGLSDEEARPYYRLSAEGHHEFHDLLNLDPRARGPLHPGTREHGSFHALAHAAFLGGPVEDLYGSAHPILGPGGDNPEGPATFSVERAFAETLDRVTQGRAWSAALRHLVTVDRISTNSPIIGTLVATSCTAGILVVGLWQAVANARRQTAEARLREEEVRLRAEQRRQEQVRTDLARHIVDFVQERGIAEVHPDVLQAILTSSTPAIVDLAYNNVLSHLSLDRSD